MLFSLLHPIVPAKGRNTSGSAICHCERNSWPDVQVVPTLPQSGENLGSECFVLLSEVPRRQSKIPPEITDLERES
jgi:hypothetical protein